VHIHYGCVPALAAHSCQIDSSLLSIHIIIIISNSNNHNNSNNRLCRLALCVSRCTHMLSVGMIHRAWKALNEGSVQNIIIYIYIYIYIVTPCLTCVGPTHKGYVQLKEGQYFSTALHIKCTFCWKRGSIYGKYTKCVFSHRPVVVMFASSDQDPECVCVCVCVRACMHVCVCDRTPSEDCGESSSTVSIAFKLNIDRLPGINLDVVRRGAIDRPCFGCKVMI